MSKPIVICIDDEQIVLDSLIREISESLENECDIETALGGAEALELVDELIKDGSEIALVISDYIMPDIKGDEVLRYVHEKLPQTLKIMLTGEATVEGIVNAINSAKLYRYISKPWHS
jgi:DNA-binding NtrC family response regulator